MRGVQLTFVLMALGCGARTGLDEILAEDASVQDVNPVDAPHDAPHDAGVDADADAGADADADAGSDADAETPSLTLATVAIGADRVSPADQGIYPDGHQDGYFSAKAVGPFDALILVTTLNGQPAYGQQWDTLVLSDPVPPLGFSFSVGKYTWVLGVWENNQRVSDNACRISLGPGAHDLELVGSDSGYFNPGVEFRLWGRVNGNWIASNTDTWK
jgi:hypothetical protein